MRRYVRGGSAQKLDWLVVEEITQLDMALWADLACVELSADVKFLLLGDFRQLPAVLDSWAGRPISAPLEHRISEHCKHLEPVFGGKRANLEARAARLTQDTKNALSEFTVFSAFCSKNGAVTKR